MFLVLLAVVGRGVTGMGVTGGGVGEVLDDLFDLEATGLGVGRRDGDWVVGFLVGPFVGLSVMVGSSSAQMKPVPDPVSDVHTNPAQQEVKSLSPAHSLPPKKSQVCDIIFLLVETHKML